MNNEIPNNEYFIVYSNHFIFEGKTLAFRKKELFDITNIPTIIKFNNNANCWIINRKQLTKSKAQSLIKNESKQVNVSQLQWYQQEQLNHVFNL